MTFLQNTEIRLLARSHVFFHSIPWMKIISLKYPPILAEIGSYGVYLQQIGSTNQQNILKNLQIAKEINAFSPFLLLLLFLICPLLSPSTSHKIAQKLSNITATICSLYRALVNSRVQPLFLDLIDRRTSENIKPKLKVSFFTLILFFIQICLFNQVYVIILNCFLFHLLLSITNNKRWKFSNQSNLGLYRLARSLFILLKPILFSFSR